MKTLKWLSSLPILMQESFWWCQCSDRYIISLFHHLRTPLTPPPPPLLPVPNKPCGFCGRKHLICLLTFRGAVLSANNCGSTHCLLQGGLGTVARLTSFCRVVLALWHDSLPSAGRSWHCGTTHCLLQGGLGTVA